MFEKSLMLLFIVVTAFLGTVGAVFWFFIYLLFIKPRRNQKR